MTAWARKYLLFASSLIFTLTSFFHCKEPAVTVVAPPANHPDSSYVFRDPFWSPDGKTIYGVSHVWGVTGDDFYTVDSSRLWQNS